MLLYRLLLPGFNCFCDASAACLKRYSLVSNNLTIIIQFSHFFYKIECFIFHFVKFTKYPVVQLVHTLQPAAVIRKAGKRPAPLFFSFLGRFLDSYVSPP